MNLNFLNPLSSEFLKREVDKSYLRSLEAKRNSYGRDEDSVNWSAMMNGIQNADRFGVGSEQSNILFEAVFTTKRQRLMFYRSMAYYPIVKKGLTMMTDEACCENSQGELLDFNIKPVFQDQFKVAEFNQLKKEFDYVVNCVIKKDAIWYLFYKWLRDGEQFWELCPNDIGDSLVGIKLLPPACSLVIYDDGVKEGFIQDPRMIDPDTENEIKRFTLDQVAYCNYSEHDFGVNRNDIIGHLEPAIRPLNQLRAIEDALTVYRLTRAPEKRVFNIAVGRMRPDAVKAFMHEQMARYRKTLTLDPVSGLINQMNNTQAFTEDFWFPKDDTGTCSTVESFKGGVEFNGQLDDVKMFQQQIMDAMQIPVSRWSDTEGAGTYAMAPEQQLSEITFQKLCRRLAKRFTNELIVHTFIQQLRLRGYDEKYLDSDIYEITMHGSNDFQRIREIAQAEKLGGVVGSFSTFLPTLANSGDTAEDLQPLFSRRYFYEKILHMPTEDIVENNRLLEEEKQKIIDKAKAAKEQEAPEGDEEGGGDDMGF